jgi:hypothetical protein
LLANETDHRKSLYYKINYRFPSFLTGTSKPRWRYYSVTALPLENKGNRWVVVATFLTPALNFDQSDHTRPTLRHHGSIFIACFGYDAAISGEMSRRRHTELNILQRWVYQM